MKIRYKARIVKGAAVPLPAFEAKVSVGRSRFKPGEIVDIIEESEKKTRTLAQNARYWKCIVPYFAEWAGYEEFPERAERMGYAPKDSAHEVLKAMFLPELEETLPDGSVIKIRPSTASLTVAQMSELQEKAERFLVQNGVRLPAGDEYE